MIRRGMKRKTAIWPFTVLVGLILFIWNVVDITVSVKSMWNPTSIPYGHQSRRHFNLSLDWKLKDDPSSRHRRSSESEPVIPVPSNPFHTEFMCHWNPDMVIGGVEAVAHSQPWMAYVIAKLPSGGRRRCAGTVISDRWVVSAGHCFNADRNKATSVWITLGAHDVSKTERERTIVYKTSADNIFVHDLYDDRHLYYDIALIMLPARIPADHPHIRPACLPLDERDPDWDTIVTASGWGLISIVPRMVSDQLQTLKVRLVRCPQHTPMHLCTAKRHGVKQAQDTCLGDSGGPLVWKDGQQVKIVGVLSFGSDSCDGAPWKIPAHYSRLANSLDWMKKTIIKETTSTAITRDNDKESATYYC